MVKKDLREMKRKKMNKEEKVRKTINDATGKDVDVSSENVKQIEEAEEVMKRYEGKSEKELIDELKNLQEKGDFNDEMLEGFYQNVAPMLDVDQKNKLISIIRMLKNKPD